MSSLEEINNLFIQAQKAIEVGNTAEVKNILWPQIRVAVGDLPDLSYEERRKMSLLIYDHLDKFGLQPAGKATKYLSIDELMKQMQSSEDLPPMWHP